MVSGNGLPCTDCYSDHSFLCYRRRLPQTTLAHPKLTSLPLFLFIILSQCDISLRLQETKNIVDIFMLLLFTSCLPSDDKDSMLSITDLTAD